jgi:hypothetical protein
MGTLKGPIQFTGSIGGIRCYYDKALKRWIISTKGGQSKELVKKSPALKLQRENMNEFKVCSHWASQLQRSLISICHLHKGYYFPKIVKLGKTINKHDTINAHGIRSLESSKASRLLLGINFNLFHSFDEVFSLPYAVLFSEDKKTVTLKLLGLISRYHIKWFESYASYRITLAIAQVSDYVWNKKDRMYKPVIENALILSETSCSEWLVSGTVPQDVILEASFAEPALQISGTTVIVAMGIEFSKAKVSPNTTGTTGEGTMRIVECFV